MDREACLIPHEESQEHGVVWEQLQASLKSDSKLTRLELTLPRNMETDQLGLCLKQEFRGEVLERFLFR
jgi:hypothetical protein